MYQTTEPAQYWQSQLVEWGPRVLFAVLILVATHFIAKAVQWGISRIVDKMPVLKRHPGVGGDSVGRELGRLGYWLIWLVGLIAALQPLGLSGVLTPVTSMTNEVFAFLPRLLGAGLFFFAGLILARIVRHIIEAALGALNLERMASQAGLKLGETPVAVDSAGTASEGVAPARSSIARAVGVTVSATIIIFAAIGALQILQISAISDPATAMLNTIALAIPRVLAAMVWLAIAFLIGKWVKTLIETVLPSLGFDNNVRALGIMPSQANPSRVVGTIAMTAILLGAAIEAALGALNLERLAGQAGLKLGETPVAVDSAGTASEGVAPARSSIARAVGVTVSATIIIFAAIGALQILQISAISDPATAMLNTIALAIPRVLAAMVLSIAVAGSLIAEIWRI